jgi:hypothetical protein
VGSHLVQVWAKNNGSSADWDVVAQDTINVTAPTAQVTSLAANASFPVAPGIPVTWTATASGSAEFRFWTYSNGQWTMARDYSTVNTVTWTPPAGSNAVQVWVRAIGSTAAYEDARDSGLFTVASGAARMISLTSNVAFPNSPQQWITWIASAAGGSAALEYKFWLLDESLGTWTVLRDWAPGTQASWFPGTANAGRHRIQVWVRSMGSGLAYEDFRDTGSFMLTDVVRVTLTTNRPLAGIRSGTINVSAQVTGNGGGPWEYVFFTWDGTAWTRMGTYSAAAGANTATLSLMPGTKEVQVWVRAATGSHADYENWATTGVFVVNP